MKDKFIKISVNIVGILIAIIILALFIGSLITTAKFTNTSWKEYSENIIFVIDNVFLNVIFIILFMGLLYFLNRVLKKVNLKILLIVSLVLIGIIGAFWVNYIKAPVRADAMMVYNIALDFLDGKYDSISLPGYMGMHPMQMGIVFFIELFYRIVRVRNSLMFQNFNVILILLCCFLIYKICKLLYKNEKISKALIILLPFFIVMPMASVFVYGNIIGLVFALLAIFFLLKYLDGRKNRYLILIPFTMLFSIIVKENYEIILIAIIIILLLDFLKEFKIRNLAIIILAVVLVKFSNPLVYMIAEKRSNIKVPAGTPMIAYVAMGIYERSDRAPGWYNNQFNVESVYIENSFDEEATKKESMKVIENRLLYFKDNPIEFFKYYIQKIGSTWFEPAFQTIWTSEAMEENNEEIEEYYSSQKLIPSILSGKISNIIIKYLDILEITVFASSFVYIVWSLKNKILNYKNIILLVSFLGGFFFHILWETKCIYALPFYFMLLPSSVAGLIKIFEFLENKFKIKKKL
jgi:hypothetical protein